MAGVVCPVCHRCLSVDVTGAKRLRDRTMSYPLPEHTWPEVKDGDPFVSEESVRNAGKVCETRWSR